MSASNINKQNTALDSLRANFNREIKFIADRTYLQPMIPTDGSMEPTNFQNRQFEQLLNPSAKFINPVKSGKCVRGIHGLRHATRVAIYTDMLHRFRVKKIVNTDGSPDQFPETAVDSVAKFFKIKSEDVLMLTKFAAFFHDSARENEGIDYWDHRSAENCYDFLVSRGVGDRVARFFANAARYKGGKEDAAAFKTYVTGELGIQEGNYENFNYIRDLIGYADRLDVMRCKKEFNGIPVKYFSVPATRRVQSNKDNLNNLMLDIHQLLAAEGDLDSSGCPIKISKAQPGFLKTNTVRSEWDHNMKLDFEYSEDPYGMMQKYINDYIDRKNLQALQPTKPSDETSARLNMPDNSLITACDWGKVFTNNSQFTFIADHQSNQTGHIVAKKEPSSQIINIKQNCIEFPLSDNASTLSEDQLSATMVVLAELIKQGQHNQQNPLIIQPNEAFTVPMITALIERIEQDKLLVNFAPDTISSDEIKKILAEHNNKAHPSTTTRRPR